MAYQRSEAIVLRRTRFSETSLILVLFSRRYGRIDAIAKGCRRPKSPMRGHLDLFNLEDVLVIEKNSGLSILTETDLLEEYVTLRQRPAAYACACLLGEIVRLSCMIHDPHPAAFDILTTGLKRLDEGEDVGVQTVAMLLGILKDLGFAPSLHTCPQCGEELRENQAHRLCGVKGGLLCEECLPERSDESLTAGMIAALRYLERTGTGESAPRLQLKQADTLALIRNLASYTEENLGRGLRSTRHLLRYLRDTEASLSISK